MNTTDATRATAEAMPEISRRNFLLKTTIAGAAVAVAVPVAAAEPETTPHEQAWWHIRELERLVVEDGGEKPTIIIQSEYGEHDFRCIGVSVFGRDIDDGMFAAKGGAA